MVQGASIVHHIPGRVRVRVPHARHNRQLLNQVRDFVSGLHGVRQVEINAYTGTIVVHYAPESEEHLKWLMPPMPELPGEELVEEVEAETEFLAEHSASALAIVNFFKELNSGVRQAMGNTVDLKVLLPGGLAVWAFLKTNSEAATPLWVTLAIFSINSFLTLHHSTRAPAAPQVPG